MDKDRIKGAAEKIKGTAEATVGKLIGDKDLETKGKIDKATGAVRTAVGQGKDAVRDAVDKRLKWRE
jgi:uncharacterized protein YjbJ (UPF0337 family)